MKLHQLVEVLIEELFQDGFIPDKCQHPAHVFEMALKEYRVEQINDHIKNIELEESEERYKPLIEALEFYGDKLSWVNKFQTSPDIYRERVDESDVEKFHFPERTFGGKLARATLKAFKEG